MPSIAHPLAFVTVNGIRKPRRLCLGTDILNTISPDQMGEIYRLAGYMGLKCETDIRLRVGVEIDQVSIAFADLYIKELKNRRAGAVQELGEVG